MSHDLSWFSGQILREKSLCVQHLYNVEESKKEKKKKQSSRRIEGNRPNFAIDKIHQSGRDSGNRGRMKGSKLSVKRMWSVKNNWLGFRSKSGSRRFENGTKGKCRRRHDETLLRYYSVFALLKLRVRERRSSRPKEPGKNVSPLGY